MNKVLVWIRDNLMSNIMAIIMLLTGVSLIYVTIAITFMFGTVTSLNIKVSHTKKYTITASLRVPLFDYKRAITDTIDSTDADKKIKLLTGKSLKQVEELSVVEYSTGGDGQ